MQKTSSSKKVTLINDLGDIAILIYQCFNLRNWICIQLKGNQLLREVRGVIERLRGEIENESLTHSRDLQSRLPPPFHIGWGIYIPKRFFYRTSLIQLGCFPVTHENQVRFTHQRDRGWYRNRFRLLFVCHDPNPDPTASLHSALK
jgi:hypothetical protein